MPRTPDEDARFKAEAARVYGRYATEFIEALRLCPWAERSRAEGHTEERYLTGSEPDDAATLEAIGALAATDSVEVGLVIFPELALERADFERWVSRIREADVARARPGRAPFAIAAFHPDAEPRTDTPYRLVPFIRRAPDPLIQCIRVSILDAMRKGEHGTNYVDPNGKDLMEVWKALQNRKPPLHERVAETNLETLTEFGVEHARAMLDEILDDRDRSYAPFGVPPRRTR